MAIAFEGASLKNTKEVLALGVLQRITMIFSMPISCFFSV